jgi:hypothetical protein
MPVSSTTLLQVPKIILPSSICIDSLRKYLVHGVSCWLTSSTELLNVPLSLCMQALECLCKYQGDIGYAEYILATQVN